MVQRPLGMLSGGWPTGHLAGDRIRGFASNGQRPVRITIMDEAIEAIRAVRADYPLHSAAARQIALEHFDSDKILRRLLAEAGLA